LYFEIYSIALLHNSLNLTMVGNMFLGELFFNKEGTHFQYLQSYNKNIAWKREIIRFKMIVLGPFEINSILKKYYIIIIAYKSNKLICLPIFLIFNHGPKVQNF